MMGIKHARNAVKSKSIKVVLIHPEPQITKKKSHNLVAAIVEQPAVPQLVLSLGTTMEIAAICAIKLVQAVQHVLGGVTVDYVQKHNNSESVCSINELLQLLRCTISTACSKEAVDLVAEAGIVCMLHDSHQLNNIVSQMVYSRQHILCELLVQRHSQLWGRDSNVCFVDSCGEGLLRSRVLEHITFGGRRVPESTVINRRDVQILSDICDPSWDSFNSFAGGQDHGNL